MSNTPQNSQDQFLNIQNLQSQPAPSSSPATPVTKDESNTSADDLGFDFTELIQYLRKERLRELKITSTNKSKIGSYIIVMSPTKLNARIRPRQADEMVIKCNLTQGEATLNDGPISVENREKIAQLFDKINVETEKGWSKVDTLK